MKKNKKLKKEVLLYKKNIILTLKEYINKNKNYDDVLNIIGDVSLTNEIISVIDKLTIMEQKMMNILDFSFYNRYFNLETRDEFINTKNYYEALLNEIVKVKYNNKKYVLKKIN